MMTASLKLAHNTLLLTNPALQLRRIALPTTLSLCNRGNTYNGYKANEYRFSRANDWRS